MAKKTHFFARAPRAGGAAGRRPPKGARQKLARAKKSRLKPAPKLTHTNFGNSYFHMTNTDFWNSTIYRSSPLLEFHFPSYTLHFWNSTICISPPIMEFQLSSSQLWNSNYRPYYYHYHLKILS